MSKKLLTAIILVAAALQAQAPGTVEQLLQRISARETQFLTALKSWSPILEIYIQETPSKQQPAGADHYMLGRLQFGKSVEYATFITHETPKKRDPFFMLRRGKDLTFVPQGFAQMTVLDSHEFGPSAYAFEYVRREFLGEVRCLVFDVTPKDRQAKGKFIGRIWVEDQEYSIVRFNGIYTDAKPGEVYFHFDSWRMNTAPGVWVPAFLYVEENDYGKNGLSFKAQGRLWGYNNQRAGKIDELTSILVESGAPVKDEAAADASPLENQRRWERQAEENYIQRLEKSGLLSPKGKVDEVLDTVINNLLATNNLNLDVQCRVLLTSPFETFTIGHTIVISRGLLDVLPDEASLAVVLSDELAHIALGHRTDTMYAFGDQTMFDDRQIADRLRLSRPQQEMDEANRKGLALLAQSPYKDKLGTAALFLKALGGRAPVLRNLIYPNLGSQLANGEGLLRLNDLAKHGPALDQNKIEQVAALPLGSRIKLDPWSNQIALLKAKPVELLSAREKMPFEITPFVIALTRAGSPAASDAAVGASAR